MADLAHEGVYFDAVLPQKQLGYRSGGDTGGGFAGAAAASTAIVSVTELGLPGVVGMTGAKGCGQVVVIGRTLVFVRDEQGDGRAGGFAFEYATEHLYGIAFLALRNDSALAWASAIQVVLDKIEVERESGRATVQNATYSRPVGFAESGDAKDGAEGIACHVYAGLCVANG